MCTLKQVTTSPSTDEKLSQKQLETPRGHGSLVFQKVSFSWSLLCSLHNQKTPGNHVMRTAEAILDGKDDAIGFGSEDFLMRKVSIRVPSSHRVAVVGLSDSGKSTLLGLAALLYQPHQGEVRLNGLDAHSPHGVELQRQVFLMRHEVDVFADTLLENIRYGTPEATITAVEQAAEFSGLMQGLQLPIGHAHVLDRLVRGPDAAGLPGEVLSMEAQLRLEMARCYLQDPEAILPTPRHPLSRTA